jgi:hypothetical protein
VAGWSFLTGHARVLLCVAHDPGVRLRGIAARTGITERTTYGIGTDLTEWLSMGDLPDREDPGLAGPVRRYRGSRQYRRR